MSDKTTDTSGATEATAPAARAHNAGDGGAVAGGRAGAIALFTHSPF
jgi:hypothetical protein